MRLFVDENLGAHFVSALWAAGLDVIWAVPDFSGWSDAAIANHAAEQGLVIVTEDRGFPEILMSRHDKTFGVIVLRLFRLTEPDRTQRAVREILRLRSGIIGCVAAVEPSGTRLVPANPTS